jgi:hypothetical protein
MLQSVETVRVSAGLKMLCTPMAMAKMPSATRRYWSGTPTSTVTPSTKPRNMNGTRRFSSALERCSRLRLPRNADSTRSISAISGTR